MYTTSSSGIEKLCFKVHNSTAMDYAFWAVLISSISLLISFYLLFLEFLQRKRKIHMRIQDYHLIDGLNNTLYFALDVAFVNQASIAKTIYQIRFQPQEGYQIFEVRGVPNFELETVTFQPHQEGKSLVVKSDDVSSLPLDIEPYHSKSVYFAVGVHPIDLSRYESSKELFPTSVGLLLAVNHHDKIVASDNILIPL